MKPFVWPVRVYWEDTDAGGIVYHANWLRFLERGRTEWLRSLGIDQRALDATAGIVFVVRDLQIDFVAPARLDDRLVVTVALLEARRASLTLTQQALSADVPADSDAALRVKARCRVAAIRRDTGRPVALPDLLTARLPAPAA